LRQPVHAWRCEWPFHEEKVYFYFCERWLTLSPFYRERLYVPVMPSVV
jgi:hypothetical protein